MTYARRTDRTHAPVIAALRACGWYVLQTFMLPNCCDCIAVRRGAVRFIEIKDGSLTPSRQQLTAGEAEFQAGMRDAGVRVHMILSVEDAARLR